MRLTPEQDAIRVASAELKGTDCLRVVAFAGAGKTSTLRASAGARSDRGLYLAFNRAIADEAQRKFRDTRAIARTMHAAVYRVMKDEIEETIPGRARCVLDSGVLPPGREGPWSGARGWTRYRFAAAVAQTVSEFCSSADPDLTGAHARDALISILGDPGYMPDGRRRDRAEEALDELSGPLSKQATAFVQNCLEKGRYTHDLYLKLADLDPNITQAALGQFGYLMIDEAQDLNPVQRSILAKSGRPVIAVGDPYQQIYSWRGSENALESLPGKTLYLTGSFRFGDNIAGIARKILQARPDGGPRQRLEGLGNGQVPAGWKGPSVGLVCRTNAGAIDAASRLIENGATLRFHVDNFDHIRLEVESLDALRAGEREQIQSPRVQRFRSWEEALEEAEYGRDPEMSRLVKLVDEGGASKVRKVDELRTGAEDAQVAICTGHRSKGLEWPSARLWEDFASFEELQESYHKARESGPGAVQSAIEEWNLTYVAGTRAMQKVAFPESLRAALMPAEDTPEP